MYKDYAAGHKSDMYYELSECINSGVIKKFPELEYKNKYFSINIFPYKDGAIITSQDVTNHMQVEKKIKHLNEILTTIRNIDQLITHNKNHGTLLQGVCDNLIKISSLSYAWVVLCNKYGEITSKHHAGLESKKFKY